MSDYKIEKNVAIPGPKGSQYPFEDADEDIDGAIDRAARIVLTWNSHDALLEALEKAVDLAEFWIAGHFACSEDETDYPTLTPPEIEDHRQKMSAQEDRVITESLAPLRATLKASKGES